MSCEALQLLCDQWDVSLAGPNPQAQPQATAQRHVLDVQRLHAGQVNLLAFTDNRKQWDSANLCSCVALTALLRQGWATRARNVNDVHGLHACMHALKMHRMVRQLAKYQAWI